MSCLWENMVNCSCVFDICEESVTGDLKVCPISLIQIDSTSSSVSELFADVIDGANHGPYNNSECSLEVGEQTTVELIPVSTGIPITLSNKVDRSIWFTTPSTGYYSIHTMSYTGQDQPPPIISVYDPDTGILEANLCEHDNELYGTYPYEQDHCALYTSGRKLIRIVGVNTNFSIRLSVMD